MFYADDAHNIILDTFKIDGKFYGVQSSLGQSDAGINLDGNSSDISISNLQVYNNSDHGIYLGV